MKPALIIGSTCVDVIIEIDHLPVTEENIHPKSQTMALGGCAYNVASVLRLLGIPHTLLSPVGSGLYGDFVARELAARHIPISIRIPDQDNGCCYCFVEAGGERTFLSLHGAEYRFRREWLDACRAEDYSLAYLCGLEIGEDTGIYLIEYLEANPNLPFCYAPGPCGARIAGEKTERILALHPLLHLNEREACSLSGMDFVPDRDSFREAASLLHEKTGNTVIITRGDKGAYCMEKDGHAYAVPPVPVSHVADTIGAGDAHMGAVMAGRMKGLPMEQAIACANRLSAAVVEVHGAALPAERLPGELWKIFL